MLRAMLWLFLLLVLSFPALAEEPKGPEKPQGETGPRPKPAEPVDPVTIDQAIARGIAFLLADQNPDGSWGSAERTKDLNIFAPVPGAHHAFRAAVTALCVSSLCETGDSQESAKAIERGEKWLLEHLPKLRRADGLALYNVWGHAYSIEALVRLHARAYSDSAKQEELRRQIAIQVDLLDRYETVHGGWGYYDFNAQTKKPSGEPTSFTTATVLAAFHQAKGIGVEVPQRLIDRGLAVVRRQKKPDFSYAYSDDLRFRPQHPVNMPGGSLGRSNACNYVLRLHGDKDVTDAVLKTWLDRLVARNLWLDMGRKRPIPHESWYAVAGYFFYYGHYYSAFCIEQLPAADRPELQHHLAHILLDLQEKDGCWWDYPLYNYHQQYGTAFALMTLKRCKVQGP